MFAVVRGCPQGMGLAHKGHRGCEGEGGCREKCFDGCSLEGGGLGLERLV